MFLLAFANIMNGLTVALRNINFLLVYFLLLPYQSASKPLTMKQFSESEMLTLMFVFLLPLMKN